MILIYKKDGKTSIIETKTIRYEIFPIYDEGGAETGNYRIEMETMVYTNTGVHNEIFNFFAVDDSEVMVFENFISENIKKGIVDTRLYNRGGIK